MKLEVGTLRSSHMLAKATAMMATGGGIGSFPVPSGDRGFYTD